jgi:hypothetical protein
MDKKKENKDIFFRHNYKYMVAYNLNSRVEKVLEKHFKITTIKMIEEKDDPQLSKDQEMPDDRI